MLQNNNGLFRLDSIDYERQQQINAEFEYSNYIQRLQKERPMTIVSLSVLFILLLSSNNVECGEGIEFSVVATIVMKLILALPVEIAFVFMIKYQRIKASTIQLIKLWMLFVFQGWYIYVWVKFFDSENNWKQDNYYLYLADFFIVIEAFIIFFTMCWCLSLISWILWLFIFVKKGEEAEKKQNLKVKDILLHVASLKLNPSQFSRDDEWAICWDQFQPEQQIIRLPWNEKHYFHADWIGEWISIKTVCPICKAQITEETIKKFKEGKNRDSKVSDKLLQDQDSFELN